MNKNIIVIIFAILAFSLTSTSFATGQCQDKDIAFEDFEAKIVSKTFKSLAGVKQLGSCTLAATLSNLCEETEFGSTSYQLMNYNLAKNPRIKNSKDMLSDFNDVYYGPAIGAASIGLDTYEGLKISASSQQVTVEIADNSGRVDAKTHFKLRDGEVVSILHTRYNKTPLEGGIWNRFACGEEEASIADCNNVTGSPCI